MDFKGPWRQGKRGPNNCPIVGTEQGMMICMLAANTSEHPEYERYANLIAAAPEMFGALEVALCALKEADKVCFKHDGAISVQVALARDKVRRIITKAKGAKNAEE